jgi:outer membrane biosynthesis protein TonB
MRSERFLVTSSFRHRKQTRVWDSDQPIALDQNFNWILENSTGEPKIRYIGKSHLKKSSQLIQIDSSTPFGQFKTQLDEDLEVCIEKLRPIPPAYLAPAPEEGSTQLLAFSGSGRSLFGFEKLHSTYVGYSKKNPIFTLQREHDSYHIRPLLPGVALKLKGQKSVPGKPGDQWKLSANELASCTVVRAHRWWRFCFSSANHQGFTNAEGIASIEDSDTSNRTFYLSLVTLLAILSAFSVAVFKLRQAPPEVKTEEEAPVVQFVVKKEKPINEKIEQPKPLKQAEQPQPKTPTVPEKTTPPKRTPTKPLPPKPAPSQPKPVQAAAEKTPPTQPKPIILKPSVAPPTAIQPKKALPVAPSAGNKPRADAAPRKASASRIAALAALKDALGGAMALTKKSVNTSQEPATSTHSLIGSNSETSSNALKPTEITPGYSGANDGVGTIGGKLGGAGYGTGQNMGAGNHKGSFVSISEQGMAVEKGLLQEEVGAVIHKHMDEVRYCHESAMLYHPNANGKLLVKFSIAPNGTVESAATETSTLEDPQMENCILKKLKTWRFPKPKGGIHVAVSYPFIFKVLERN